MQPFRPKSGRRDVRRSGLRGLRRGGQDERENLFCPLRFSPVPDSSRICRMILKADLKSLFVFAAPLVCLAYLSSGVSARVASGAAAQDDPNAQYILIQSGELSRETREIEVPVEVGVWKLQFNLQSTGDLDWTIITPSDRPISTDT